MTTLPKDVLSCLLSASLSYAKCSVGNPEQRACIIYSSRRKTIVSMGYQVDLISPEEEASRKLRWLDRGDLYAISTHSPTACGADALIRMKIKEFYYMTNASPVGIIKLKEHNIFTTRLIYG